MIYTRLFMLESFVLPIRFNADVHHSFKNLAVHIEQRNVMAALKKSFKILI